MAIAMGGLLVVLGVAFRLMPHPPNAVPLGAICLFAAARLPRRWSWLVPALAMVVSDAIVDLWPWYPGMAVDWTTRATIYATYLAIAALGGLVPKGATAWTRDGLAFGAATLFYLTSNFAVWASGGEAMYPRSVAGLLACYVAALPFFGNAVLAELLGNRALFELEPAVARWMTAVAERARRALAPVRA